MFYLQPGYHSEVSIQNFFIVILYSWLCLSEIAMPSIHKFLIIGLLYLCSILSGFSLSSVFWSILGELMCMHISNSATNSSSRTASCHVLFYIILWISALWISMDFISFTSRPERIIIDILLSQLTLYYVEWANLLKFWQYYFISRHQVSIIMAPSEDIYGRKCSNV